MLHLVVTFNFFLISQVNHLFLEDSMETAVI